MLTKLDTLLDETIELVREARKALAHYQRPLDWTLLYGPRGTEMRRPNDPIITPDTSPPERVEIGP